MGDCRACLKSGHMCARCESKVFCKCGSDRRHHKLLHHPYKKNKGDAEQEPRSGKQSQKPPAPCDPQVDREVPSSVKPRTTEQYATVAGTVSKTVLLHVVSVNVIAPNGSTLTTYGLLDNASRGILVLAVSQDSILQIISQSVPEGGVITGGTRELYWLNIMA